MLFPFLVIFLKIIHKIELTSFSCVARSHSPWVAIYDQDQAKLELVGVRRVSIKGAQQLLQMERNLPMEQSLCWVLPRTQIKQTAFQSTNCKTLYQLQKSYHIHPSSVFLGWPDGIVFTIEMPH